MFAQPISKNGVEVENRRRNQPAQQQFDSTDLNSSRKGTPFLSLCRKPSAMAVRFRLRVQPKISIAAGQFTNANKNSWEDLWRNAALQTLGFGASVTGMNDYINQVKSTFNAQWTYALFVTKHPIAWFAYEWGNHVILFLRVPDKNGV
mgnify:CR=1 FL=1